MKNIFKTFKENKSLLEENKLLKAQNESLIQFRKSFDDYYRDISNVKIIERSYNNRVVLNGVFNFDDIGSHYPIEECKKRICNEISRQLMPYIEFDIVDNNAYGTKSLVGEILVLTK